MSDIRPDQRGVISGLLNLSRNLGLITGASVMGAVFAFGTATSNIMTAPSRAIASGMQLTFGVATVLIVFALALMLATHISSRKAAIQKRTQESSRGIY